ncbi:Afadin and alpha-actinin-binding-domain-containing protein [Rhypophila decipiens]|uniref:Afadin and alpha-actinin-binding-domain-containing protein n=1 Tax=Rhypophila decipiens TaxID=261697 RepID=A0AAN6YJD6_9PEZI|nr:Afadin and alpha-actinin-binding-domain-containing protein [Rhypophila decipiens]
MTTENLRTASLYINNQLLSRGLLRDGETIDFTNPSGGEGGTGATMGRIMAVVNDLILRRDRDAEQRESLATTLRTVRAESLRQTNDLQRLQDRYNEAARKLAISEASEASLKTQLKTAEATIHRLKDEAARQKTFVNQTRAACANEVRKRDRQIEGLKKAVSEAGRARGMGRGGAVVVSVSGSPAPSAAGADESNVSFAGAGQLQQGATAPSEEMYDLRSETNAFLAELAKGLSEENENLVGLVRRTMVRLKEMSGWENHEVNAADVGEMATEIDAILEHLRTILTNPSFVPIEEVVVREDEINKLRNGWEMMESRWHEAVHLIDGWKRRMQVSGRPVNMEELKMGLRLSPVRVKNVEETHQGLGVGPLKLGLSPVAEHEADDLGRDPSPAGSLRLVPAPRAEDDGYADDRSDVSSIFEDDVEDDFDVDQLDVEEPNVEILEQSVMFASPPLPTPPQLSPLRDNYAAGNRGGALNYHNGPGDFTTFVEERTADLRDDAPLPPPHAHLPAPQPSPTKKPSPQPIRPVPNEEDSPALPTPPSADLNSSLDSILLAKPAEEEKPPAVPRHRQQKPKQQQAPSGPPRVPPKEEKQEREKRKPPVPKQPVPARKLVRSNSVKTNTRTQTRGQQAQDSAKSSPSTAAAPTSALSSKRVVSGSSAVSVDTTTTASVADSSSTSIGSNPVTANPSPKVAPASSSTDRDAAMMPPPPLPPTSAKTDNTSSSSSAELNRSPKRPGSGVNSRLPLPRPASTTNLRGDATHQLNMGLLPPPQQSPLSMATIQAKLAASEREADAARVRAKLKAARLGKRVSLVAPIATGDSENSGNSRPSSALSGNNTASPSIRRVRNSNLAADEEEDELAADSKPTSGPSSSPRKRLGGQEKKTSSTTTIATKEADEVEPQQQQQQQARKLKREKRPVPATNGAARGTSSRRASRRRSTLNPWELETLIKNGVEAATPVKLAAGGEP